jgi:hypothetical protein
MLARVNLYKNLVMISDSARDVQGNVSVVSVRLLQKARHDGSASSEILT